MKRMIYLSMIGWGLAAAQTAPKPDDLKAAIQAQLNEEKPACVALFDKNDPTGHLMLKATRGMGATPKLDAYYAHGLVVRQETRVAIGTNIIPAALLAKHKNAWRYDWAPDVATDVVDDTLCYGYDRQVVRVLRWSQEGKTATVSYDWRFREIAVWAKQSWLEAADPEVWSTATGNQFHGLGTVTLFNDGWH